jgi:hypothetical protein
MCVCAAVLAFLNECEMTSIVNNTVLVLIPKKYEILKR